MHLQEEEKNRLNGILGTVSVHLLVLIVFLIARIDKVRDVHQEPILIEFDEQLYEELRKQMTESKAEQSDVAPLSDQTVKNIAVNTANRLEEEISTEKYIEQLKQELNIDELNQQHERELGDDPQLQAEEDDTEEPQPKNSYYDGPTRISYNLENRTDRYIHVPVYKCQGHGTVVVAIVVNPQGEVIGASVESSSTQELCIKNAALESARISHFNRDANADPRQKGTISYEFIAQ